ncbi:hypothetical protein R3P38DRAFT_2810119 [Favolaschia claudopus]|uniref:F-box domain-containing protein n=1 Tax=Favolaschia claudopus TaxID=2862362 RepID=A0AAV9ZBN1_9AGAR
MPPAPSDAAITAGTPQDVARLQIGRPDETIHRLDPRDSVILTRAAWSACGRRPNRAVSPVHCRSVPLLVSRATIGACVAQRNLSLAFGLAYLIPLTPFHVDPSQDTSSWNRTDISVGLQSIAAKSSVVRRCVRTIEYENNDKSNWKVLLLFRGAIGSGIHNYFLSSCGVRHGLPAYLKRDACKTEDVNGPTGSVLQDCRSLLVKLGLTHLVPASFRQMREVIERFVTATPAGRLGRAEVMGSLAGEASGSDFFNSSASTNYAANDDEVLEILNLIAEPARQLCSIEAEIADLQKAIDKLEEKRRDLNVYVDGHKALISPVRRMPPDVLSEIFIACLPTHRNCAMSASEAPVLLGRICSSWRALSLATPRLWASLHITEPIRMYGRYPDLAVAKMAQLHSGCFYPAHLDILAADSERDLIERLLAFASRWQRVLAHLKVEDVPLLKEIAVVPHDGGRSESQAAPLNLRWPYFELLKSPLITSFSTDGRHPGDLAAIPLRCGHLEEISIGGESVSNSALDGSQALQLLSQCNRLRTCKLVINMMVMHSFSLEHGQVELPLLHTLHLNLLGPRSSALLDQLSSPELRTLIFRGDGERLPSFLGSCCHLETFTIEMSDVEESHLSESLRILPPTMRHISLLDHHYNAHAPKSLDDSVLAILAQNCPALKTLEVGHNSIEYVRFGP